MASHNVRIDRQILGKWLKSGMVFNRLLQPTTEGTPQGRNHLSHTCQCNSRRHGKDAEGKVQGKIYGRETLSSESEPCKVCGRLHRHRRQEGNFGGDKGHADGLPRQAWSHAVRRKDLDNAYR